MPTQLKPSFREGFRAGSGSDPPRPVSIGDDPGGDECGNVDIRYNLLVSGDSPALSFYSGSVTDQDIYCNRVESLGAPIGIVGQPTDIRFSFNEVVSGDSAAVQTGTAHGADVVFCGTTPSSVGVTGGGSVTISDPPCQDGTAGCAGDVGARVTGGGPIDGGPRADGGPGTDGGPMTRPDGGMIVSDAAEPLDGSAVADGGATARDGATQRDAGRGPDSGRSESGASDGCSCRVTGRGARAAHGLTLVLAAAAALWRGRRASRSKTRQ